MFNVISSTPIPQDGPHLSMEEFTDHGDNSNNISEDSSIQGGIFYDLKHIWLVKGSELEVRYLGTGRKVGSWKFGGTLRDQSIRITAVEEVKRGHGKLSFLLVALYYPSSGSTLCVFDSFGSKILRTIEIEEQVTKLHILDSGCEVSLIPDSSPLRYFQGVVAVGTLGGNVFLLDLYKEVCECANEYLDSSFRDQESPCKMTLLKKDKLGKIKKYIERAVANDEHLAIHLNVVENPLTEHFTLKGEDGEDRVHVNRSELEVSALFYSPQTASLLIGYNFGAFQMWDLRTFNLCYTSPICEGNTPITHFSIQEPADDPKAYCYIWVSFSHNLLYSSRLPFAVMYSFYFDNKKLVEGYGNLYENFQHCSLRLQIDLDDTQLTTCKSLVKGGICLGFQSITKRTSAKDLSSLALCLISWLVWDDNREINTSVLVFDLNQWYKEQMPRVPNWSHCSNYMIKSGVNGRSFDVKMDTKSLRQFMGIQKLEEYFCPTSLSFDLWSLTPGAILKIHNKGIQRMFLDEIVSSRHLALIKPENYSERIVTLGLVPLFCEVIPNNGLDVDYEREILMNVVLEQKLLGWLCQTASKLVNDSFKASGLSIYNILKWAFQRAVGLKNALYNYCIPLFDHSGMQLDENTLTLISSGNDQIRNLCSFYKFVSGKLMQFVPDQDGLLDEQKLLENMVVYFEVVLWMSNVGLLPERQLRGIANSVLNAPYLIQELTEYYNKKRAQLQLSCGGTFVEKDCLLFIDNMINNMAGAEILRQQWQEDGGSGLYPPPSLQSVLRTYLIEGPDLVTKHSLVTYILLDIAASVDEHNKIIKLLLKFPQIFALPLSNIKLIQSFWHLDHDHYETALDSILDPCVLLEDLQQWHHSVIMRSLLMQDQSTLALRYWQIRKPCIQNEKDLLTVISLLISRNMLDEAFKFQLQYKGLNEYALLEQIFNECNKNGMLHSLLYRKLSTDEERAFLKYLQNTKTPRCEDLQVFYYFLRSRFLEAFDSYFLTRRKQPDTQGMLGQREGSTADNVVKMFKNLMPDVNRRLMDLVRKERTSLWKEVPRPTPFSVFVHSARDRVKYKSSVYFAALSKAKQTFNETMETPELTTEDTPFLRTPTAFRSRTVLETSILKSEIIEQNSEIKYGPSPAKRLRLSARASKTSPLQARNIPLNAKEPKFSTPIVQRKRQSLEDGKISEVIPQSILKSRSVLDDSIFNENITVNTSMQAEYENSIRKSRLGLMHRKSVRTPVKSHVKFDDLRYSGSSTERSSSVSVSPSCFHTSKQLAASIDSITNDVQFEDDSNKSKLNEFQESFAAKSMSVIKSTLDYVTQGKENSSAEHSSVIVENKRDEIDQITNPRESSANSTSFQSPKSRKSYKRSLAKSPTTVLSSPRLARKLTTSSNNDDTSKKSQSDSLLSLSPVGVQKTRGRKSLSRAVLEHNTFLHVQEYPNTDLNITHKSVFSSAESTATESDIEMESDISFSSFTWKKFDDSCLEMMSEKTEVGESESVRSSAAGESSYVETPEFFEHGLQEKHVEKTETFLITENVTSDTSEDNIKDISCESLQNLPSPKPSQKSSDDESPSQLEADLSLVDGENINIYNDLSSGSEDAKQVRQQLNTGDEENTFSGSFNYGVQDKDDNEYAFILEESSNESPNGSDYNSDVSDVLNVGIIGNENSCHSQHNDYKPTDKPEQDLQPSKPTEVNDQESLRLENDEKMDVSVFAVEENIACADDEQVLNTEASKAISDGVKTEANDLTKQPEVSQRPQSQNFTTVEVENVQISDNLTTNETQSEIALNQTGEIYEALQNTLDRSLEEGVSPAAEKRSISLQCTIALQGQSRPTEICNEDSLTSDEKPLDSDGNLARSDETESADSSSPNVSLMIRTVKKTYHHKRGVDVDSTPRLATELTQRTYTRKVAGVMDDSKPSKDLSPEALSRGIEATIGDTDAQISDSMEHQVDSLKMPSKAGLKSADVHSTPKLTTELTRRTYSRKAMLSKVCDDSKPNTQSPNDDGAYTGEILKHQSDNVGSSTAIVGTSQGQNCKDDRDVTETKVTADDAIVVTETRESLSISKISTEPVEKDDSRVHENLAEESQNTRFEGVRMTRTRRALSVQESDTSRESFSNLKTDVSMARTGSESNIGVGSLAIYARLASKTTKGKAASSKTGESQLRVDKSKKRGRSSSVDQPSSSATKRSTRSSNDLDDLALGWGHRRTGSKLKLNSVGEASATSIESPKKVAKSKSKASSHLGDYTTSRVLTRSQANVLEAINSDVDNKIQVDDLDPLHLLDKSEFTGNPDPEEAKVYDTSPNLDTYTRKGRSASVTSDTASTTPKFSTKNLSLSGIKTRLRRRSADTLSVTSEKSNNSFDTNQSDDESAPGGAMTLRSRTRAGSVSSTKSESSDKSRVLSRSTRTRKLQSAKRDLPEIEEENVVERSARSPEAITKKRGRK
ncbi:protein ELYS isoform X2 [Euwallacea similis]|uniref:protein ELYS isoform X2 n=1 Tax=Euwallacea similis TaxID=1736056 RepID=UPI00344D8A2A